MRIAYHNVILPCSDTVSNVPYEALGPELTSSPAIRAKLFFVQKMFNFSGMLVAAAAPATLAYLLRAATRARVSFPCSYFYPVGLARNDSRSGVSSSRVEEYGLEGPWQLSYTDSGINKTAELCVSEIGAFCFETQYENGTRYWYE